MLYQAVTRPLECCNRQVTRHNAVTGKSQDILNAATGKSQDLLNAVTGKSQDILNAVTAKSQDILNAVTAKSQDIFLHIYGWKLGQNNHDSSWLRVGDRADIAIRLRS